MDRTGLALLAKKPNLAKALARYFQTPEGQAALAHAPAIQSEAGRRPMTEAEAIAALLEEAAHMEPS